MQKGSAARPVILLLLLLYSAESLRDATGEVSVHSHSAAATADLTSLVRDDARCCCQKVDEDAVNNKVCVREKSGEVYMYDEKRGENPRKYGKYNRHIDIKREITGMFNKTCPWQYGSRCNTDHHIPTASCELCLSEIVTLGWFKKGRGTFHAVSGSTVPEFNGRTYLEYNKVLLEVAPNQTKDVCMAEKCLTHIDDLTGGCKQQSTCLRHEQVRWCPEGLKLYRRIGTTGSCFSSKMLSKTFALFGKKTCPRDQYHRSSDVNPEGDEVANSFCDCGGECF